MLSAVQTREMSTNAQVIWHCSYAVDQQMQKGTFSRIKFHISILLKKNNWKMETQHLFSKIFLLGKEIIFISLSALEKKKNLQGHLQHCLTRYTEMELLKCKSKWESGGGGKLAPQRDKEQVTKRQDMTFSYNVQLQVTTRECPELQKHLTQTIGLQGDL